METLYFLQTEKRGFLVLQLGVAMTWVFHLLNARGQLALLEDLLRTTLEDARTSLEAVGQPIKLDVVIRAADYPMPEALLVGGSAYAPGRIELTIDVARNVPAEILREQLLKTIYHEYHHAVRWDGPGYGNSLGEALVSEGLAQVFVHEMMVCPPEPWEAPLSEHEMSHLCKLAYDAFDDEDYSHDAWFFGSESLPNWAGYSRGKLLVVRYLDEVPGRTAMGSAGEAASAFREFLLV